MLKMIVEMQKTIIYIENESAAYAYANTGNIIK